MTQNHPIYQAFQNYCEAYSNRTGTAEERQKRIDDALRAYLDALEGR